MERRRFMQLAALSGLAVMVPKGIRNVSANAAMYPGPYYIMVNAGGGWDPTELCDPKGGAMGNKNSVNQLYSPDQIGQAGNIRYAPISESLQAGQNNPVEVYSAKRFFEAHHHRLLVLNGVDQESNNHDSGNRTTWCGQLAEGYPSFAALAAGLASQSYSLPMAYVSNGGYDATEGVVSLTRGGGPDALLRLAYTDRLDPAKADYLVHTNSTASRIAQAQAARLQAMQSAARLPTAQHAMSSLYMARNSDGGLDRLAQALQSTKLITLDAIPDLKPVANQLGDVQNLMQQAHLALLAFQSGVAVSAGLDTGGFDTHSNHDANQTSRLVRLMRGLDFLFTTADAMGLSNKIVVVIGSDFGRTPFYNAGNGKDHWSITSMMLAGYKIPGDRVIGATDAGFKAIPVNATNLRPDPNGVHISSAHVHKALRKLAGVDGTKMVEPFPLPGDDLPLFSA